MSSSLGAWFGVQWDGLLICMKTETMGIPEISMLNVDRWKKLLGEATGAVEVVTFDYPCMMLFP